jgi:hypothetical protein
MVEFVPKHPLLFMFYTNVRQPAPMATDTSQKWPKCWLRFCLESISNVGYRMDVPDDGKVTL